MPNHIEPVTIKIVLHMHKKSDGKDPDSLDSVLCKWSVLGIFFSCLLSESAQNASNKKKSLMGIKILRLAFILPDLAFLGVD